MPHIAAIRGVLPGHEHRQQDVTDVLAEVVLGPAAAAPTVALLRR